MGVVNSRVKAGSSLVAPQGIRSVGYNVRECTVEELKQFIPLRGVVESCLVTAETNRIMDYMLREREREGDIRNTVHEPTVALSLHTRVLRLTTSGTHKFSKEISNFEFPDRGFQNEHV